MADEQTTRVDAAELNRWIANLAPGDAAAVRAALHRDPELRSQVELILAGLPEHLREAFLDRFHPELANCERPASAVMEGLRGLAGARARPTPDRHHEGEDRS